MFKRRLNALGYVEWDKVNINDSQHFRKVTVWLEDQKIRQYDIQDRKPLRDLKDENWPNLFTKYCADAKCPVLGNTLNQLEWLLGYAIWLEVENNNEVYSEKVKEKKLKLKKEAVVPRLKSKNSLDNLDWLTNWWLAGHRGHLCLAATLNGLLHTSQTLTIAVDKKRKDGGIHCDRQSLVGMKEDVHRGSKAEEPPVASHQLVNPVVKFDSNEFRNGTYSVAKLLRIPRHLNHLLTLKACSKLVKGRLNTECLKDPNSKIIRGKPFPVMSIAPGFELNKPALENAAKILALLYIQDIRNLQTKINEVIVRVQSITANPKTDTKLGKVGK